jgi:hypothetical protein
MKWMKVLVPVAVVLLGGGGFLAMRMMRRPAVIILYAPPEAAAEIKIDDQPARIEKSQTLRIDGKGMHKIELVGAPAETLSGAEGWGVPTRRSMCFELTEGSEVRPYMLSHPFHLPAKAFAEGRFHSAPCRDLKYESNL